MKVYVVQIIYKNGVTIDFECTKFLTGYSEGKLVEVEWEVPTGVKIKPFYINLPEVSSIWQVGEYERYGE